MVATKKIKVLNYGTGLRKVMGVFALLFLFSSCSKPNYKPGDVYLVDTGEEKFRIVKVLAVDSGLIHLRMYKEKFDRRPSTIDTRQLSIGEPGDPAGFGARHIPLTIDAFKEWEPELITNEKVTEEELEVIK